jgi:hypothetical protein
MPALTCGSFALEQRAASVRGDLIVDCRFEEPGNN